MKNVINSFSRDLWLSYFTEGWLMIRSHMSNNEVTYSPDHTVTWGHVTNELHYIFILRSLLPLNLTWWWLVKLKSRRLKFWLNWKNSGKDTLFLKHFYFSINFTNFEKNICVDQVVLKMRVLHQEKNFWSALR